MIVLKLLAKLILIPVVICLTVVKWAGVFLNSISGVILGILAFIFALTGISSLLFGLASGPEALKIILTGFVVFMISVAGEAIVTVISVANAGLREFIRS